MSDIDKRIFIGNPIAQPNLFDIVQQIYVAKSVYYKETIT